MSLEGRLSVQQCSNQSLLFNDVQNEPWFWSVDREKSKDLLSKGKLTDRVCTVSNMLQYSTVFILGQRNGTFLIRPASQKCSCDAPYCLSIFSSERVFHVPIRKNPNEKYALGTQKSNEEVKIKIQKNAICFTLSCFQEFESIQELVTVYQRKELSLVSNRGQVSRCRLLRYPI